jgi:hypothetical protein
LAEVPGATNPDDAVGSDGFAAVKRLAENTALRLSTDDRVAKRFHALIRIAFRTRDGAGGTTYLVQGDNERIAILIMTDEGLPFCYMSNGFLAAFDPKKLGHLVVHEGGETRRSS